MVEPSRPYLERNRLIVVMGHVLVAVPDGPERTRSGTWHTVRWARQAGLEITLLWPDGTRSWEAGQGRLL